MVFEIYLALVLETGLGHQRNEVMHLFIDVGQWQGGRSVEQDAPLRHRIPKNYGFGSRYWSVG